jgi:hypothetical protein
MSPAQFSGLSLSNSRSDTVRLPRGDYSDPVFATQVLGQLETAIRQIGIYPETLRGHSSTPESMGSGRVGSPFQANWVPPANLRRVSRRSPSFQGFSPSPDLQQGQLPRSTSLQMLPDVNEGEESEDIVGPVRRKK